MAVHLYVYVMSVCWNLTISGISLRTTQKFVRLIVWIKLDDLRKWVAKCSSYQSSWSLKTLKTKDIFHVTSLSPCGGILFEVAGWWLVNQVNSESNGIYGLKKLGNKEERYISLAGPLFERSKKGKNQFGQGNVATNCLTTIIIITRINKSCEDWLYEALPKCGISIRASMHCKLMYAAVCIVLLLAWISFSRWTMQATKGFLEVYPHWCWLLGDKRTSQVECSDENLWMNSSVTALVDLCWSNEAASSPAYVMKAWAGCSIKPFQCVIQTLQLSCSNVPIDVTAWSSSQADKSIVAVACEFWGTCVQSWPRQNPEQPQLACNISKDWSLLTVSVQEKLSMLQVRSATLVWMADSLEPALVRRPSEVCNINAPAPESAFGRVVQRHQQ